MCQAATSKAEKGDPLGTKVDYHNSKQANIAKINMLISFDAMISTI